MPISSGMMVYKNKPEKRPVITVTRTVEQGAKEASITIDSHTGTHIDAPAHMIANSAGMEAYPLKHFMGPCRVIDFTKVDERITAADIDQHIPSKGEWILLKTKNSFDATFNPHFVYLDATGARSLAKAGIMGVGIDALGIEREQPGHETHTTILYKGIIILEGLRLADVKPGRYHLIALPLSIPGIDGAPCRAVLVEDIL